MELFAVQILLQSVESAVFFWFWRKFDYTGILILGISSLLRVGRRITAWLDSIGFGEPWTAITDNQYLPLLISFIGVLGVFSFLNEYQRKHSEKFR